MRKRERFLADVVSFGAAGYYYETVDPIVAEATFGNFLAWWPLWLAALLPALGLLMLGSPSRSRRTIGWAFLVALPLTIASWWYWADSGGFDGEYKGVLETVAAGTWLWLGLAVVAGCLATALWAVVMLIDKLRSGSAGPTA